MFVYLQGIERPKIKVHSLFLITRRYEEETSTDKETRENYEQQNMELRMQLAKQTQKIGKLYINISDTVFSLPSY